MTMPRIDHAGHSHAGHSHGMHHHGHFNASMTGILGISVAATLLLVVVELSAGYAAHSIALISDAVHNLTDVPMLVISWLATRWALRPPTPEKTYGYHRAGHPGGVCERHAADDRCGFRDLRIGSAIPQPR